MKTIREVGMLSVGDKAPDFHVQNDIGETVSLKDFKGKKVILYFYPKDDTPGCTKEACGFRDLGKAFEKKNAVILGVSADTPESHTKFKRKYGIPFPLLSDTNKKVLRAYNVWKEKISFGKTSKGIVRTTYVISPDGTINRIFPNVHVDGHIEEVLESI